MQEVEVAEVVLDSLLLLVLELVLELVLLLHE